MGGATRLTVSGQVTYDVIWQSFGASTHLIQAVNCLDVLKENSRAVAVLNTVFVA